MLMDLQLARAFPSPFLNAGCTVGVPIWLIWSAGPIKQQLTNWLDCSESPAEDTPKTATMARAISSATLAMTRQGMLSDPAALRGLRLLTPAIAISKLGCRDVGSLRGPGCLLCLLQ